MRKYLLHSAFLLLSIGCVTDTDVAESQQSEPKPLESQPLSNGEAAVESTPADGPPPADDVDGGGAPAVDVEQGEPQVDDAAEAGEGEGEGEGETAVVDAGDNKDLDQYIDLLQGHELPCDGSVTVYLDGDQVKADFSSIESSVKTNKDQSWWRKRASKLDCAFEVVMKARDEGKRIVVDETTIEGDAEVNARSRPQVCAWLNGEYDEVHINNSGKFSVPMGIDASARCGRPLRLRMKVRAVAKIGSVVSLKRMLMRAQVRDCRPLDRLRR